MKIGSSADLAPDWEGSPESGVTQAQAGEKLSEVASRLGVSAEALQKANPQIGDPDQLTPGSEIRIPAAEVSGSFRSEDAQSTGKASSSYMERNFEASMMKSMLSNSSALNFMPPNSPSPTGSGGIAQMPPVAPGVEGYSDKENEDVKAALHKVYTAAEKLGISHDDLVSMLHTLAGNRPVTPEKMTSALRLFFMAKDLSPADRKLVDEAFKKSHADPDYVNALKKLVADPKFTNASTQTKKDWLDKFGNLAQNPQLKGLSDTQRSIVLGALASDPPPSADKISSTIDVINAGKDLAPGDRKLYEDGLKAAEGDPAYAANLKKLIADPKFTHLKPAEKTAVLSQTKNYPDARAVANIDRLLQKGWFQAESLDNKQRSLKMVGKLSTYDAGDRGIIDNTLDKFLDPSSHRKIEWKQYPKNSTIFGEADGNTLELNRDKIPADNNKLPEDYNTKEMTLGTVPHEVNHNLNGDKVSETFKYFQAEYRAWFVSFKAEHGRAPTNQEAMEQNVGWQLNPKSWYWPNALKAAMKNPKEAEQFYRFLESVTGQTVNAKNWRDVVKSDPATWPDKGQSPAPVPPGNVDNH